MRLSIPHHRYSAKKKISFDEGYCVSAQNNASNIFTQAPRKYAGQLKTFPRHLLSDAMCLDDILHEKAEDSRGFDLDASPILRSLISRSAKTLHRALSPRSTVLAEKEELCSVTPAQICDSSLGCLQMTRHGLSCLFPRIARSPACVSVRKVFFLAHYAEEIYLTPNLAATRFH